MVGAVEPRRIRPRDAASIVIWRREGQDLSILLGRRARKSRFMPDLFVFPGGRVDREDLRRTVPLAPACLERITRHCGARQAHALAAAVIRETEEETGLRLRDSHALDYLGRAITPSHFPMRFHARFFAAPAEAFDGTPGATEELVDLDFYPLEKARELAVIDVTGFMLDRLVNGHLHGAAVAAPAFLRYRGKVIQVTDE
jgi:8-oxo-dGTP pyrophosphatase MutT (NUDIX family)